MLKSNEILTLYAIIEKSNNEELKQISYCCIQEIVKRTEKEYYEHVPISIIEYGKEKTQGE